MVTAQQSLAEFAQRVADPVDLRRIGFGNQREALAGGLGYIHDPSMVSGHDAAVTA